MKFNLKQPSAQFKNQFYCWGQNNLNQLSLEDKKFYIKP